jgi:O-antigen/teichoic acid export membrane protein
MPAIHISNYDFEVLVPKRSILKSFSRDLSYSVAGLVCMNGMLQLAVYPVLQSTMGAEAFGIALSLFSVISIMCCAFASGANYSRMVAAAHDDIVAGDYNVFILVVSLVSVVVAVVSAIWVGWDDAANIFGLSTLMVFSVLRYYGDVDFRLSLDYRGFFLYYLVVSLGYLAGIGLVYFGRSVFDLTQWWWVSIALGECAAFVYVLRRGRLYRRPYFQRSDIFRKHIRSIAVLSSAYLLSAVIMNADRILILAFIGSAEVTVFYTASLLGKTVALLTSPLNGVVIGYLSKRKEGIAKRMIVLFSGIMTGVGIVLTALTVVASYILVRILYPGVFDAAQPLFLIASIGQVLYFLGETMLVVLLRMVNERYQLVINGAYAVLFFSLAVPLVVTVGLWGMAWAILIAASIRFAAIVIIAFVKAD